MIRETGGLARAIQAQMQQRKQDFISLVRQLAELESPTCEATSQRAVQRLLVQRLEALGLRARISRGNRFGGCLLAVPWPRQRRQAYQLLVGHTDTVWPLGTLSERPVVLAGETLTGPGVFDMKSGLAQAVLSLEVLASLGYRPASLALTPVVLFNSDEEMGSSESTRWIRWLARGATRALILEPALGLTGKLKTTRKGVGGFKVSVRGKAAHAGLAPEEGASAILELSFVIQKLFALNDAARGITVNVGTIDGGLRSNVVAPESYASVDVRVPTEVEAVRIAREIESIQAVTPGVSVEIRGGFGRPPLEATPRNRGLWEVARGLASELGQNLEEGSAGGGSDGNTTSLYTATLDGLGAVGEGAHSLHECIDVDRSLGRAALLALLLLAEPREEEP